VVPIGFQRARIRVPPAAPQTEIETQGQRSQPWSTLTNGSNSSVPAARNVRVAARYDGIVIRWNEPDEWACIRQIRDLLSVSNNLMKWNTWASSPTFPRPLGWGRVVATRLIHG